MFMLMCEDGWESRWVKSDWKRSEGKGGSFKHIAGQWPVDPDDRGLCFTSFYSKLYSLLHTNENSSLKKSKLLTQRKKNLKPEIGRFLDYKWTYY